MEIPIGYFFATAYFSFATGAIGVFIVMQILQLLGWADWLGKNKSTSLEKKIYDADSVDSLIGAVESEKDDIYGDGGRWYSSLAIANMINAVDGYLNPDAWPRPQTSESEQKYGKYVSQHYAIQRDLINYIKAEKRDDPFSIIPNKDIREKLKQLESEVGLKREEYSKPPEQPNQEAKKKPK